MRFRNYVIGVSVLTMLGCSGLGTPTSQVNKVEDIATAIQNANGSWTVVCKDGRREDYPNKATYLEALNSDKICSPEATPTPVPQPGSIFLDMCSSSDPQSSNARKTIDFILSHANTNDCAQATKWLASQTKLGSDIKDLRILSDLTNLRELALLDNQITDLRPLSGLINLTRLNLNLNQITDLRPLSGLINLTRLDLSDNKKITDIQPLSGLTNLTSLSLEKNRITDIQPLSGLTNLTELNLDRNQITDVQPLSRLINLTQLYLGFGGIKDIQPLINLTKMTRLYLAFNQITDIQPLSGFAGLTWLYLDRNKITDVQPLSDLLEMKELGLSSNPIEKAKCPTGTKNMPLNKFCNASPPTPTPFN